MWVISVVIEKVQSTKSGLTEACSSLLIGFEVRDVESRRKSQCRLVAPETLSGVRKEKGGERINLVLKGN